MKKIIVFILAIAAVFTFTACSGSETPSMAWADMETLVYKVENTSTKEVLGEMKVVTERRPSDTTLDGHEYSADGKVTINVKTKDAELNSVLLTTKFTVVASEKTYKNFNDESKNYTLVSNHSGKNYFYSLNGGEEKKLKTGNSGYTDSEYIYHYIRSYPLSSPPSSVKVAYPLENRVVKVSCTAYAAEKVNVPYPDGVKEVECTVVAVSLSDSPKGKSILVSFTPDSKDYYVEGRSISPSRKLPVKIMENDIMYTLTSVEVR